MKIGSTGCRHTPFVHEESFPWVSHLWQHFVVFGSGVSPLIVVDDHARFCCPIFGDCIDPFGKFSCSNILQLTDIKGLTERF